MRHLMVLSLYQNNNKKWSVCHQKRQVFVMVFYLPFCTCFSCFVLNLPTDFVFRKNEWTSDTSRISTKLFEWNIELPYILEKLLKLKEEPRIINFTALFFCWARYIFKSEKEFAFYQVFTGFFQLSCGKLSCIRRTCLWNPELPINFATTVSFPGLFCCPALLGLACFIWCLFWKSQPGVFPMQGAAVLSYWTITKAFCKILPFAWPSKTPCAFWGSVCRCCWE